MILDSDKIFPQDLKKLKTKELKQLAKEIRERIIDISKGKAIHLSSNLGIVELSMALLYVFDSPKDQILYDTGHQCYVHKILTGRNDLMDTIREDNGLSGFQDPKESQHDFLSTGHSGNMLSIAQGIIENLEDKSRYFVPVVGDAAISNGLSFEALNNIAYNKTNMVIVLNDNGMSISQNVGALYKSLSKFKLSRFFFFIERALRKICGKYNWTRKIYLFLFKAWNRLENAFFGKNLFQDLGFYYFGIVDGNNIKRTIRGLQKAKWYSYHGPVILHVKTKKGLGLEVAENDKEGVYHSGTTKPKNENQKSDNLLTFGEVAANKLEQLVMQDNDIRIINPAMTLSTGFLSMSQKYKKNYEDVGISEEHAVSKASGIALIGKKPFIVIYSSFLQRTYDQILHDVSRNNLPINFLVERSDIAYGDGDTHHGIYDLGFLKTIPNTIISEASNGDELIHLIDLAYQNKQNPFFVKYTKEKTEIKNLQLNFKVGDWLTMQSKPNAKKCLISYGILLNGLKKELKEDNIDIYNAVFVHGFNLNVVISVLKKYDEVYVAEKCFYQNSLLSDLEKICFENKINCKLIGFNIKTNKIGFGSPKTIDQKLGIDSNTIVSKIRESKV